MPSIKVEGMRCGHCSKSVTEALVKANAGKVDVNLESGMVSWDGALESAEVKKIIEMLGFTPLAD